MAVRRLTTSLTIALSAALLFSIQPMIAKVLLPRFGGSAGVWVASMMFFQIVLLLGYLYSFWITRYPSPAVRTAVHIVLLLGSLAVLPLRPRVGWASSHPTLAILAILAVTVGLPFFLLSTTNTLVQSWYARKDQLPYHLFALSNTMCVVALLAYPLLIEPSLTATLQLQWWSVGYVVLVLLVAGTAVANRRWTPKDASEPEYEEDYYPWLWIALAACPSALWLAVANHLSQEVAAIPLLWVLPLTLYLLSFVVCFATDWYRPEVFRWLLPVAWIAIGLRIGIADTAGNLGLDIGLILAGFFVLCVFCHGELANSKPDTRQGLAFFYLMTATGGALGGIFVGVVAPAIFTSYLELPVGIVGTVFLALVLVYRMRAKWRLIRLGAVAVVAFFVASTFRPGTARVADTRNFYGILGIRDRGDGDQAVRTLYNGRTVHGIQFLSSDLRRLPTAYYGRQSGVGLLFGAFDVPNRRAGMIGLGAGTLAAYGRKGDRFRFYEINPASIDAASKYFTFLSDSAAHIDVVEGDGRLKLAQEPAASFDILVLDAFSDDSIPVHLLTREAFQLYFTRLRPGGALAIHVSNRYLDLGPVVASLARTVGKSVWLIHSAPDSDQHTLRADWVIVADADSLAARLQPFADQSPPKPGPLWTDEYSNLLQIWQ